MTTEEVLLIVNSFLQEECAMRITVTIEKDVLDELVRETKTKSKAIGQVGI